MHRDPKIPTLPAGTCRACSALTVFLDTLPGTSGPVSQQRPIGIHLPASAAVHQGRGYHVEQVLSRETRYLPCARPGGRDSNTTRKGHVATHQARLLWPWESSCSLRTHLSVGRVLFVGMGETLPTGSISWRELETRRFSGVPGMLVVLLYTRVCVCVCVICIHLHGSLPDLFPSLCSLLLLSLLT